MALINCMSCHKIESSEADACRHCGNPPNAVPPEPEKSSSAGKPNLPDDLSIPTSVSSFGWTAAECRAIVSAACEIPGAPWGESVTISRRKEGFYIYGLYGKELTRVHYSQVFSAQFIEAMKVKQSSKSVLGRAAFGAVLLGPFGAVVGGMSGMGKNENPIHGMRLIYWNVDKDRYDTLLLETGNDLLRNLARLIADESAPFRSIHDKAMA